MRSSVLMEAIFHKLWQGFIRNQRESVEPVGAIVLEEHQKSPKLCFVSLMSRKKKDSKETTYVETLSDLEAVSNKTNRKSNHR